MALAVVRDLHKYQAPVSEEELAEFETDVLAEFVLARASAGLVDSTIRNHTNHLELIRDRFSRPLWEMEPADADVYFGEESSMPSCPARYSTASHGTASGSSPRNRPT
ncbi:hypothetical protein [Streptomyces sp. NPDC058683]|uniref:hypothetical protein n=1 Tax=Streptomyces sp. NPDC058683 TaxID=3346597 RepID=UPI003656DF78